ncbi:MAG TPA: hypothetical protein VNZ26_09395 [Vicinamibacterales bacterium]|jgi:hypothetical protein|nr:hypothetical protein [Vicinamibacterales bacterium]
MTDSKQAEIVDRLANALQTALMLVEHLKTDTEFLRQSIAIAATAAHELRTAKDHEQ